MRPGREIILSRPFSAEIKNEWSHAFVSPIRLHGGDRHITFYFSEGPRVAQWLRCCATIRKVPGSIPAVSGFSVGIKAFRSHYGPGVDSAFNRNEYREYFLGVKAAGA